MSKRTRGITLLLGVVGAIGWAFQATPAQADTSSCREWRHEHRHWKTEVLRRYLKGAPQSRVDDAVFELLQREAWLTSCDVSVRVGRDELVGWRLSDKLPDEYGNAVVESVLDRAGFEVTLHPLFIDASPPVARTAPAPEPRRTGPRLSSWRARPD